MGRACSGRTKRDPSGALQMLCVCARPRVWLSIARAAGWVCSCGMSHVQLASQQVPPTSKQAADEHMRSGSLGSLRFVCERSARRSATPPLQLKPARPFPKPRSHGAAGPGEHLLCAGRVPHARGVPGVARRRRLQPQQHTGLLAVIEAAAAIARTPTPHPVHLASLAAAAAALGETRPAYPAACPGLA